MDARSTAPRIIHVALFTRNPKELAPFYRDAFGMEIVHARNAVQLWDGHILLALNPWRGIGDEKLRIDEVGEPQAKGFDHFGFQIEDVEEAKQRLRRSRRRSRSPNARPVEPSPNGGLTTRKATASIFLKTATSRFRRTNFRRWKLPPLRKSIGL